MKRLCIIFLTCSFYASGQQEIFLDNPSFEDIPHQGTSHDIGIRGWFDCGIIQFPSESPPDIHPVSSNSYASNAYWQVTKMAQHGDTYLGLVIRDNDSWEAVSQKLSKPLLAGKCYSMSVNLAQSEQYISGSKLLSEKYNSQAKVNYTEPTVLRIYGGVGVCERQEILAKSPAINHSHWNEYILRFEPSQDLNYITLEAFYEVPVIEPYNGHILVDNISSIQEIPCIEEVAIVEKEKVEIVETSIVSIPVTKKVSPKIIPKEEEVDLIAEDVVSQNVIKEIPQKVSGLGYTDIQKGQVIKIENLYFPSDKAIIQEESFDELSQLYSFLKEHKGIIVEIGGHTNTVPPKEFCLKLSKARAKSVFDFLIAKGIPEQRVKYKGYGKSQPIIEDDKFDMVARKKNQRVEIKILELGS